MACVVVVAVAVAVAVVVVVVDVVESHPVLPDGDTEIVVVN